MWTKNVENVQIFPSAGIDLALLSIFIRMEIIICTFFKHTQRKTHTTGLRQLREELLHLLVRWVLVGQWMDGGQGRMTAAAAAAAATAPSQPSASGGRTKKHGSSVGRSWERNARRSTDAG